MDPKAIQEATIRLERAREAVADMEAGRHTFAFAEFESAWWRFLLAASGVYAKLEQGSKTSGKSRAWFGREKYTRKHDPLLSYLHQARNSEEHSLEGSTKQTGISAVSVNKRVKVVYSDPDRTEVERIIVPEDMPVGSSLVRLIAPGIRLVNVTNSRFGDTFPIPTVHLGKPIADGSPTGVAKLGLAYIEKMISEASQLVE